MKPAIYLLLLLCSCSVIKKSSKDKTESSVKTESDSSGTSINKTTTRITESIDTLVKIPGSEIEGLWKELPFTLEDEDQKITISKEGKVKGIVKVREVHIVGKKETSILSETNSTASETKKVDSETKVVETQKDVKKTFVPWWLWLLIVLALLVAFRKKILSVVVG